jgi:hypothetical protein
MSEKLSPLNGLPWASSLLARRTVAGQSLLSDANDVALYERLEEASRMLHTGDVFKRLGAAGCWASCYFDLLEQ